MSLKFRCSVCDEAYVCCVATTKIYGPIIEVTCPNCKTFVRRNMSAFLHDQVSGFKIKCLPDARAMIAVAQQVSRLINDDRSWKKKKKRQ